MDAKQTAERTRKRRPTPKKYVLPYEPPCRKKARFTNIEDVKRYYEYFYNFDNKNWFLKFDGSIDSTFLLELVVSVLEQVKEQQQLTKSVFIVYPDCNFDTVDYRAKIEKELRQFVNDNSDLGFSLIFATPQITPIQRFLGLGQTLPKPLLRRYLTSLPRKLCRATINKLDKNAPWELGVIRGKNQPKYTPKTPLSYAISGLVDAQKQEFLNERQTRGLCKSPILSYCRNETFFDALESNACWAPKAGSRAIQLDSERPATMLVGYAIKCAEYRRLIDAKRCVSTGYRGGKIDIETRRNLTAMFAVLQIDRGIKYIDSNNFAVAKWLERRDNRAIRKGRLVDRKQCLEPVNKQLYFDFMLDKI